MTYLILLSRYLYESLSMKNKLYIVKIIYLLYKIKRNTAVFSSLVLFEFFELKFYV